MITPETPSTAQQDEAAVAAVRRGDPERYRELVERHARRVFAVAWSRLGDAALAEDVTQEAFIRAYRRLWLLGDGAKFSSWVSTIARRLAINLGLSHRRELDRRERWALEQPASAGPDHAEDDPPCTPETLRQTLAELPPAHRECLVLFYLEGKSGAETAAALGISESALRVRLHRARAAMRERLEDKLAGSLSQLGPAKTLVPAVMAGVLASSSAKAATAGGAGAAILGTLAKFSPFKWLFLFVPLALPLIPILPGVFFQLWRRRDERRNFRDPQGFRARLHGQLGGGWLVRFFILLILIMLFWLMQTNQIGGRKAPFLLIGLFSLVATSCLARKFEINRSRAQIAQGAGGLFMGVVCVAIWLGWLPIPVVYFDSLAPSLASLFSKRALNAPLRMDCNLFLRAAQGMLPLASGPAQPASPARFDRPALRAFARFLAESQLAFDFRWGTGGLTLFLPAIKSRPILNWRRIFPWGGDNSRLVLGGDGSVTAHCGKKDAADLAALPGSTFSDPATLENEVAVAVAAAWRHFRAGKMSLAAQAAGQIPESEIFLVPPDRTRANRWQRIFFGGMLMVCAGLVGTAWLFSERLSGMKPIAVTETQVRAFLNDTGPNPNPKVAKFNEADLAVFACLVLPPTNLYSPEGLRQMREQVTSGCGFASVKQNGWHALAVGEVPMTSVPLLDGWITWDDLGLTSQACAEYLHQNKSANASRFATGRILTPENAWSWVDQKHWQVNRLNLYTFNTLRWLRALNCLDLVDRDELIRRIAAVQDLSATPSPGEPVLHDWRDVRGLFFTPCYPALQDTFFAVATLEMLGGLDRMDREACIQGILRRHQGRGYFTSPMDSGNYNEYHIDGSTRDTIAAFETLRLLGALDRVNDLDQWQFRVASYRSSKPDAHGVRNLTWDEVEAWVCQQRLAKILRERKENPSAPVHSLLEP